MTTYFFCGAIRVAIHAIRALPGSAMTHYPEDRSGRRHPCPVPVKFT